MIKCSNCNTLNQEGSFFCSSCRASLTNDSGVLANEQSINNQNNNSNINDANNFNNFSYEQLNKNENIVQNNAVDKKLEKIKKSYKILVIIGFVFACIRIPYLVNEYFGVYPFQRSLFSLVLLFLGFIAIITYVITIVFNNNKKTKYIFGLISGIISFFTGNLLANIVGLLLIIDSIYPIKHISNRN